MRTAGGTDDEKILALADRAVDLIENSVRPKSLYRVFDCTVSGATVKLGGREFVSKRLAENLGGCKRAVLFGATLGTEADRLIKQATATDIALAMALQAAAAAKIEEVCDELENEIKTACGVRLRSRFSAGYYDLDISEQTKIFSILELTKRIGLTLTKSFEMLPTKSVTAFIGIDD